MPTRKHLPLTAWAPKTCPPYLTYVFSNVEMLLADFWRVVGERGDAA
ncbi:MAG: hypothetical protein WC091_22400 [Sulfuricellaceae bacterium]